MKIKNILKNYQIFITIAVILGGGCIGYFFFNAKEDPQNAAQIQQLLQSTTQEKEEIKETSEQPQKILVDIKGEVNKPGVYQLQPDSRVQDVVNLAGGLTKEAHHKALNLAAKLQDEQMIYVPHKDEELGEIATFNTGTTPVAESETQKVNINTADSTQLQTLSGIGEKKAAAIIQYREENGPFQSVDDLTEISGIGEKTLEKIKSSITI